MLVILAELTARLAIRYINHEITTDRGFAE